MTSPIAVLFSTIDCEETEYSFEYSVFLTHHQLFIALDPSASAGGVTLSK